MKCNIIAPVAPHSRQAQLAAYQQYLLERDGEPDYERKLFAKRESVLARYAASPVRFPGELDWALFDAQCARFDPAKPTPPELLLLLTFVKINGMEASGVRATRKLRSSTDLEWHPIELWLTLEEDYHTRILIGATQLFGFTMEQPDPPSAILEMLLGGIIRLPQRFLLPILLAGEVFGSIALWRLLRATGTVLRHYPELRDAMEERVIEVLTDEIGHVTFCRLMLGSAGLAMARTLLPSMVLGARNGMPEANLIGVGGMSLEEVAGFDVSVLPEAVRKNAFHDGNWADWASGAAEEYPLSLAV
jgi:hypothetical protein